MQRASAPTKEEMNQLYAKLSQCNIKAVALRLINPFADQFIDQSRSVLIVSERSVCYKPVHSLALSSLFVCSVAATHRRNPLVSSPSSEFLLFFSLICNNLGYTKQPLALMLSTFARTANNNA